MDNNSKRALATVQRIQEIRSIEGADSIDQYRVRGWWIVDSKEKYTVGDLVIMCEIDSWIPHKLAPFLSKGKEPRDYNGILGERLRTMKLRGALSQGLLLPMTTAFEWDSDENLWEYLDHPEAASEMGEAVYHDDRVEFPLSFTVVYADEGDDVTDLLGIQKWDPPIPAQLQGQMVGLFPTHLALKTDQPRIQNAFDEVDLNDNYEVSLKLDGSSFTLIKHGGVIRPCSRNLELKYSEENKDNSFVKQAYILEEKLTGIDNVAIQMELMGEGIQGNKEKLKGHSVYVFDIYDISGRRYYTSGERLDFCKSRGINHVPIIDQSMNINGMTVDDILSFASGPSMNSDIREGVVFKSTTRPESSFKAISNEWLLKFKE
jgi:hypothetical protein